MVEIAFAPPQDRGEVAEYMRTAFPRAKWGREGWSRLLDGRWSGPHGRFAITARDDGELVGVLGLVCATRITAEGTHQTANMTSWYVSKTHRGEGLGSKMLDLLTGEPNLTITDVSSSKAAVPVVERAGFTILDSERLIWRARPADHLLAVDRAPLQSDELPDIDRQVISDHIGLNLDPVRVQTPDGPCTLVLSVKRKHDAYVTHEVMYLGQPELFARYARMIADAVLPSSSAILSIDRRLAAAEADAEAVESFDVPRFYKSGGMPPSALDHMYSEIVLMDMKLY